MSASANPVLPSEMLSDMARRRSQRKGYLYEKSGSWMLRWREDAFDITGRPYRVQRCSVLCPAKGPGKVGKREAERIAWETVLSKLDTTSTTPQSMVTMADFIRQRFEPDRMFVMKPAGREHYRYLFANHILPSLGKYRLRDVTPIMVHDFIRVKRGGYSTQTLAHFRNAISAVFRHARRVGMFAGALPTEGLVLPRMEHKERTALTVDQAHRVIQALPGQYGVLAALLLTTGLRIGEAAGLKWKRVDFSESTLAVAETYSKRCWVSPKSAKSIRVIPVPAKVLEAMAALRSRDFLTGPDDTVFVTTHGNPLDANTTAAKILKPAVRALKMPWVSWHSFRHSNATFADQQGLTVAERQKVMGHSTGAMNLHYTHTEMERVRAKVEMIAAAVLNEKARVM